MAEVLLSDSLHAELVVYAREALPEEACGMLIGTRDLRLATQDFFRISAVRPARNLHPNREDRFLIDPLEYAQAETYCRKHAHKGLKVLGFWHSHPRSPAAPSPRDLEEAVGLQQSFPQRYLYLILSLRDSEAPDVAGWRLNEEGAKFEAVALDPTPDPSPLAGSGEA